MQSYPSVWRQRERPHCGFQLLLSSSGVAAVAGGDWSDLDVELLGFFVVKVRVAGVKVVLLLLRAAYGQRSRRKSCRPSPHMTIFCPYRSFDDYVWVLD